MAKEQFDSFVCVVWVSRDPIYALLAIYRKWDLKLRRKKKSSEVYFSVPISNRYKSCNMFSSL